ncbi:unnamed protein product, partial [Rotaria sp. Silwood1]
MNKVE